MRFAALSYAELGAPSAAPASEYGYDYFGIGELSHGSSSAGTCPGIFHRHLHGGHRLRGYFANPRNAWSEFADALTNARSTDGIANVPAMVRAVLSVLL